MFVGELGGLRGQGHAGVACRHVSPTQQPLTQPPNRVPTRRREISCRRPCDLSGDQVLLPGWGPAVTIGAGLNPPLEASGGQAARSGLPQPASRQGCFQHAERTEITALSGRFNPGTPVGIDGGTLDNGLDRLQRRWSSKGVRRIWLLLNHQAMHRSPTQPDPHEISGQGRKIRISPVGKGLAVTTSVQPHVNPHSGLQIRTCSDRKRSLKCIGWQRIAYF